MSPSRALLVVLCVSSLGACSSPSPAAGEAYAQRFVGPWRVALVEAQQSFSDYVFGDGGKLTHLLSVMDGQVVDPSQGAGLVRDPAEPAQPTCVFGEAWNSLGTDTLVIGGVCTDGVARDIELAFSSEARTSDVAVLTVGGEGGWTQPGAWRFQKCDLSPCRN